MKKSLLIGLLLLLLVGCAKTPNINYNASVNHDIKTIAIVAPKKTVELTVFYYNHPGMSFGLVGGLIAAAEFESKQSEYNALIKSKGFKTDAYFVNKLTAYLSAEKYKVVLIPSDDKRKSEHMTEYPDTEADAYLDIVVNNVGYIAGSPTSAYKLTISLSVRLVKKRNKEVVYDKVVVFGENFAVSKEVDYVGCNTKDCQADFDALKHNALKSIDGLKKAIDKVAKRIAVSLRKR